MNEFIKGVIDETFKSKKQQRFFYAKANDKSKSPKERKKWGKWSTEFSDKTNFKKLPEVAEEDKELDEIVDDNGDIARGDMPTDAPTKYTMSKSTSDQVVHSATGQMGNLTGIGGFGNRNSVNRFWTETDMSKALGYEDTLGKDEDMEDAEEHFEGELGLSDDETKDRLEKMGYDPELPDGKIRLIENPKKYIEEYIDNILAKRARENDVLTKEEDVEINPIVKKQIEALKNTLKNNNIPLSVILKHLKDNE